MEELKKLMEEQGKAFAAFRAENDKGRGADQEILAKLNAKLDETEKKLAKAQDDLEARVNLLAKGRTAADPDETKAVARKAFVNMLRKGHEKLTPEETKSLMLSNDTTGGYLAPPEYVASIIKAIVLVSPFRSIVNVRQTSATEVQQPKRTGTAAATRVGENTTRVESQNPAWGLVKLTAPEMYAEARVTFQDLEDSAFDLEALLRDEFAEQFGVTEGNECVSGNGVGKILGILDANAAGPGTPIAYSPSGTSATIAGASGAQGDPLLDYVHSVKTGYAINGKFAFNRKTLGILRKLKDTQGRYLWDPGLNGASQPTFMQYPYIECPDMQDEGANNFPIAFGDWKRAFTLLDRVEMAVTRDPYTVASSGQVKIWARRRVGGGVVLGEALKLYKCATS